MLLFMDCSDSIIGRLCFAFKDILIVLSNFVGDPVSRKLFARNGKILSVPRLNGLHFPQIMTHTCISPDLPHPGNDQTPQSPGYTVKCLKEGGGGWGRG